jgi:hypothetical protein
MYNFKCIIEYIYFITCEFLDFNCVCFYIKLINLTNHPRNNGKNVLVVFEVSAPLIMKAVIFRFMASFGLVND